VVDEMVRRSGDVDVLVITADKESDPVPLLPQATGFSMGGSLASVAAPAAATAAGFLLHGIVGESSLAMIYVLAVALAAMAGGRRESAIAAVLSVACFNFFFVEPRFTLAVSDARYLLVFAVMLCVALVISTLTHRMRSQIAESSTRERQVSSLYRLTQLLARARSKADIARIGAREICGVFDGEAAVFIADGGRLAVLAPTESGTENSSSEGAVASWTAAHSQPAGKGTNTLPGAEGLYLPLTGGEGLVGVLAWYGKGHALDLGARRHLEAFATSLGLALERAILAKESNDARVLAESERTRSAILSSISHDLRTPLTSITGAASLLRTAPDPRGELVESIYQESHRLNRQIQNLLDMTRLQSKGVEPTMEWHSPAEIAAAALEHSRSILDKRPVKVVSDPSAPLIQADGLLVEKALTNLIENAVRHGGLGAEITLTVRSEPHSMVFEVQDTGPGLPSGEGSALFEFGMTTRAEGAGMGLAVVKAVADIHRGGVSAANRPGGGSVFTLSLPLPPRQPEVPLG
jgi:two-component system sensor histidine kinase KdpD